QQKCRAIATSASQTFNPGGTAVDLIHSTEPPTSEHNAPRFQEFRCRRSQGCGRVSPPVVEPAESCCPDRYASKNSATAGCDDDKAYWARPARRRRTGVERGSSTSLGAGQGCRRIRGRKLAERSRRDCQTMASRDRKDGGHFLRGQQHA